MAALALPLTTVAKDNKELNYEIEGAGTGVQGAYLVKVTVTSKKTSITDDEIGRCAVHGVLFRGFSSKEHRQMQKPLAGTALNEQQHRDFYDDFFKSAYKSYVQTVSGSRQVLKAGKEYRITATVSVAKEQLHRDLESAGIIKGLNTGF